MSDDDTTPEPDFDDPALDDLRALLAEARATEPVPPTVAARLDATLAALREERLAQTGVVPLRRRRAAARILVAAAAVVLVGAGSVGIAQVAQHGSGGSAGSTAADSAKSDATGGSASSSPLVPEATVQAVTPRPVTKGLELSELEGELVPRFTTARFAQQAARFDPATADLVRDGVSGQYDTRTPATDAPTTSAGRAAKACPGPTIADSTTYPILLDGHAAALVLHPVVDGAQEVDAWSCDGSTELTTVTVTR